METSHLLIGCTRPFGLLLKEMCSPTISRLHVIERIFTDKKTVSPILFQDSQSCILLWFASAPHSMKSPSQTEPAKSRWPIVIHTTNRRQRHSIALRRQWKRSHSAPQTHSARPFPLLNAI